MSTSKMKKIYNYCSKLKADCTTRSAGALSKRSGESMFKILCVVIFAGFLAIPTHAQYTINVTEQQNCTVEVSPQKDTYSKGEQITVTLTADAGAAFDDFEVYYECSASEYWEVQSASAKSYGQGSKAKVQSAFAYRLELYFLDGHDDDPVEVSKGKTYTFTMPDRNVEIEALFTSNGSMYQISWDEPQNGTISIDKETDWESPTSAKAGEKISITATPEDGYMVDEVKVYERKTVGNAVYETVIPHEASAQNQTSNTKRYTFAMPANPVRVHVTFKRLPNTLEIVNNGDNTGAITIYDGRNADVLLSGRTFFKDNTWNTICLPFDLSDLSGTPLEGATVKTLQSSSYNSANGTLTLNFSNVTEIKAGMPYIVKWTNGDNITDPVFRGVTIKNTITPKEEGVLTFTGIFSPLEISGEDRTMLYMGADNMLYYPNAAMTIGSCRAYFKLNGLLAGDISSAQTAGAKVIISFDDTETTGIDNVQRSMPNVQSEAWYTINGCKLDSKPSEKGIYICNGRKVIIM